MTNQKETIIKICQAVEILLKLADKEWEFVGIKFLIPSKDSNNNIIYDANGEPVKIPLCACSDGNVDPTCECEESE